MLAERGWMMWLEVDVGLVDAEVFRQPAEARHRGAGHAGLEVLDVTQRGAQGFGQLDFRFAAFLAQLPNRLLHGELLPAGGVDGRPVHQYPMMRDAGRRLDATCERRNAGALAPRRSPSVSPGRAERDQRGFA